MQIDQKTRLNMVVGFPLAHTLSPLIHNKVYQELGLNAVLLAAPMAEADRAAESIRTLPVDLVSVTMPLKEKMVSLMDECSEEVREIQALNTIFQRDGRLSGYNTDIIGIEYVLRDVSLQGKSVLLLGAGGAARACAYVMQKQGAILYCLNRTPARALSLTRTFGGTPVSEAELPDLPLDLVVNATPTGMSGQASLLRGYPFQPGQCVFDMVYQPEETALLSEARQRGAMTYRGLDMLIAQALAQIELMTGKPLLTEHWMNLLRGHIRPAISFSKTGDSAHVRQ